MSKCKVEGYSRELYRDECCILHSRKRIDTAGIVSREDSENFKNALLNFVIGELKNQGIHHDQDSEINEQLIRDFLLGENKNNIVKDKIKNVIVDFRGVSFPGNTVSNRGDGIGVLLYLPILQSLPHCYFNECDFDCHTLKLEKTKSFFKGCKFFQPFTLRSSVFLEEYNEPLFYNCRFDKKVETVNGSEMYLYEVPLFKDCTFKDVLNLQNATFKRLVFLDDSRSNVTDFEISNCSFEEKFIFNKKPCLNKFKVVDSEFKKKFEFKENTVSKFQLSDVNFKNLFDSYKTAFTESFEIYKCIFEGFCVMENNNFLSSCVAPAEFKYVSFMDLVNFRGSKFESGLNIERANFKEGINFLNAKIPLNNSSRETFRIIKHSFDDVGNFLEGNKYFTLEMKKYREEISSEPFLSQRRVVYWFNHEVSDFGQDYVRPIELIVALGMINYLLMIAQEKNWLSKLFSSDVGGLIGEFTIFCNKFALAIFPIHRFLHEGLEFISLISYALFGILFWQLIVAVKRHTRR